MTISISKSKERRGRFDRLDDWLRRDRFVFVGWSGRMVLNYLYSYFY